ncbi:protein FAM3C-like isoform X2 [Scyliorhinus torazame]|uniref:protein FAM3C-like isoform X2 n=1 Tax=Scyliorhinus torazame TaxID=75743 RepID=UPI003B5BC6E2
MRTAALLRGIVVLLVSVLTLFLASRFVSSERKLNGVKYLAEPEVKRPLCDSQIRCPANHFSFKIVSGAASVVGPSICFNNKVIMNGIMNNIGRGLNIALINDIKLLVDFLLSVKPGTIFLLASFDDPATKMTDEARTLISELGSSFIHSVNFRDNWIFVGAKPIKEKSPFEQVMKNDKAKNKYGNWPEAVEMEGCVPRKPD